MNLLVTGALQLETEQRLEIEKMGYQIIDMPDESGVLPCEYSKVDGVICNGLFLYHSITKFENLNFIQLTSAGLDRIPLEYIMERGITLHSARGVYSIPMAEFALCSVLSVYKSITVFHHSQLEHKWSKIRDLRELFGKTVAIIGCGSVGTECAKRFASMGCRVIGVDIESRSDANYSTILSLGNLDDALKSANVLILTLPLTKESRGLVGKHELELLSHGSILINLSRGEIIDSDALISVLADRRDLIAVLDVFDEEPLPSDSPLWDFPNIIATPHNSFIGDGNQKRLFCLIKENLFNESQHHTRDSRT